MAQQRMFTVCSAISRKFAIVWTRSHGLARSWAADKWHLDPVYVDVWPTTKEDQAVTALVGLEDFYA